MGNCCRSLEIEPEINTYQRKRSDIFHQVESQHPFSNIRTDHLCNEFLAANRDGSISQSLFYRAWCNLGLSLSDPSLLFFTKLKNKERAFDTQKIFLVCLLISKGSYQLKSRILFDYYDRQGIGCLESLRQIVQKLVETVLILSYLGQSTYINPDTVSLHIQETSQNKKALIDDILQALQTPNITLTIFLLKLNQNPKFKSIFYPQSLRKMLQQKPILKQKKQEFQTIDTSIGFSPISTIGKIRIINELAQSAVQEAISQRNINELDLESQFSSSEQSLMNDPVLVSVMVNEKEYKFLLNPQEDILQQASEFAKLHHFSESDSFKLIRQISQVLDHLKQDQSKYY